ncbi:MAG: cardiolipin synthase [Clostridia bacterium BRH_c25]|nr:MAG: cardiolipin synthase [Clostridia bacterium BRH_c25]
MKKLIRVLISRAFLVGAAILIQALALIIVIWKFTSFFVYFYSICALLSVLAVLWILNGRSYPAYKLAWIIPIMVFPIFGGLFYLMLGGNKSSKRNKQKMWEISKQMRDSLGQDQGILQQLEQENRGAANQTKYIERYSACPVYTNTTTEYLTPGEKKFEILLEELKKAEHYIFLEYYIIQEGIMWNAILEILKEKVKQGVEVRVIYDDVGCLLTLPFGYDRKLEKMGIKCSVFNPFMPVMTVRLNNRDHRKIAVIDGHTGFTGGINLADEYINAYEKYGYWKDSSIVIRGDAVWSLTVMFLSMWNYLRNTDENYTAFKPSSRNTGHFTTDGYIQPFADSPLDDEAVSQSVYLNLIGKAERYVYITTPYLILDNEMTTVLCLAAKRGVDVRIITPHIPDKWYVHSVSRSNYEILIESEVSIYEYTPGFIHSKTFVVDDMFAVVGTINLDYRSLYLHFECGVWLYNTKSVSEVKEDYLLTLETCQIITYECCKSTKWYRKLGRLVLRLLAPLM